METPKSPKLLLILLSGQRNIEEVINFILHIVYNRSYKEKYLGKSRYNMLETKRKTNKKKQKKYDTSKGLPSDQTSLKMKMLRASFVTHCMSSCSCLNSHYVPLDPFLYGWKFVENRQEPIWFEGSPLPHPNYAVDESGEVDESGIAEGSRAINECEIVESEETGEKGIQRDKWKLQWPRRTWWKLLVCSFLQSFQWRC